MAIRTGKEYLDGLRDDRRLWLDGERVDDVTTHPGLSGFAQTMADVYDLQHDDRYRDRLTMESPTSGDLVSLGYVLPKSIDELIARREMIEFLARRSGGTLGRLPGVHGDDRHRPLRRPGRPGRREAGIREEHHRLSRVLPRERPEHHPQLRRRPSRRPHPPRGVPQPPGGRAERRRSGGPRRQVGRDPSPPSPTSTSRWLRTGPASRRRKSSTSRCR